MGAFRLFLFLLLKSAMVLAQISWENCGGASNVIKLNQVSIDHYPIPVPGSATISVIVSIRQDLPILLKGHVTLKRKVSYGFGSFGVSVPCISGIGSCTYDNLCDLNKQFNCPLKAGEHTFSMPIYIDNSIPMLAGTYSAIIEIEANSQLIGCVKLDNVQIQAIH